MTCNVGGADKTIRIIVGIGAVAVGLLAGLGGLVQALVFVVAAIALLTAFVGFCPLNRILGINTCKAE